MGELHRGIPTFCETVKEFLRDDFYVDYEGNCAAFVNGGYFDCLWDGKSEKKSLLAAEANENSPEETEANEYSLKETEATKTLQRRLFIWDWNDRKPTKINDICQENAYNNLIVCNFLMTILLLGTPYSCFHNRFEIKKKIVCVACVKPFNCRIAYLNCWCCCCCCCVYDNHTGKVKGSINLFCPITI